MQRALSRLASETFDCLIIGGGATGSFTARDAAMRGLSVALIEAKDFAWATSAHNSKLAHGGLRYLRNLELKLVRESLHERQRLMGIAPHLVRPLGFLLPLYGQKFRQRLMLKAGLSLYDWLGLESGEAFERAKKLPRHRWLSRSDALASEPVIDGKGFQGAFEYYDAQMYAPERIALECVIDALAHGAAAANYVAADKLIVKNAKIDGCTALDILSGERFEIRARTVLVAAGPWADLFLEQTSGRKAAHKLIRSKGIHLLVPKISDKALALEAGNGHLFALPWRGHTLLATTDTPFRGDPAQLCVSETEIADLLSGFQRYLPRAQLSREKVQFFFAGLRPLVADSSATGSRDSYNVSRRSELIDHARDDRLDGLFSALGGKWTTSRALAETITDALVRKLGKTTLPCTTAKTPLPGAGFANFEEMVRHYQIKWPGISTLPHLCHMLGSRLPQALAGARVSDLATLGESGDTLAQVGFAVREEMAQTLEDVVMRRTSLGQFGKPPSPAIERVAQLMAQQLGWSDDKRLAEIQSLERIYRTQE